VAARKGYPPVIPDAFNVALQNGQLEVAKWLREIGIELGPYAIDEAAKGGDLKTLKWVRDWVSMEPNYLRLGCFKR